VLGQYDLDDWRETIFGLCYTPHGGSGLSFSYGDVLDMPLADAVWFTERLDEQRSDEASKIRRSSRK